jgi:hypothetical protein
VFEDVGARGWISMVRYVDVERINLSQGTLSIGNFLTRKLTLGCHNSAVFVGCLHDHCLLKCCMDVIHQEIMLGPFAKKRPYYACISIITKLIKN